MKALICPSLGPAENLRVKEVDEPTAGEGEALVEVAYAGLNFFDTLIIEGKYQVKAAPPFSPGGEFSGRVVGLGPGARGFAVGDRVMGFCAYGAAAERIAIPANRLAQNPRRARARQGGRTFGRLRHEPARAQAARRDEARRNPARARRVGRGRACGGRDRQSDGRPGDRRRVIGRKARLRPPLRRGRDDQHGDRRFARAPQGPCAQGRRRGLRSGRRRADRNGAAVARLEGAPAGDRLRLGRNSQAPAQYPLAQGLRHPRRLLGRIHRPGAGSASREHGCS